MLVQKARALRILEVSALAEKRLSSTQARELYQDHSPPPPPREEPVARRERGAGCPTKRDLRRLRQLRGQADDYCPDWRDGKHTHVYSEGGCRQVENAQLTANLGWGMPSQGSAMVMTNQV